jgi:DNA-binding transcriptional ArsR family regulator
VNGDVFAALSDPTRRQVVEALGARDELTATELAAELPVTRQAVAKHLAQLHAAGLVKGRRAGRETRYRLTPAPLGEAIDWMRAVGARTDGRVPPADPRERRAGGP